MTRLKSRSLILLLFPLLVGVTACKKKTPAKPDSSQGTYFSIVQFTSDQWKTYSGQPYVLQKTVTLNGQTDTVFLSAYKVNWGEIFKIFFETDISDPKYLDRYDFNMFEENTTQSRIFSYTARDPELFTQKLEITADVFNNKIRNIYIETHKSTFWSQQTKKLFYSPVRVIQIQEHTSPLIGSDKELVIEYKF
jgi:hypothetical protein